jgi:hypothetical protein
MMNKTIKHKVSPTKIGAYLGLAVLVFASFVGMSGGKVFASTMSQASILETNMNASGTSSVFVDFKAGASDSATSLTVAFNAAFTVNATQTISATTCNAANTGPFQSATGLPTTGTLSAAGSGTTVTVSSVGPLTSGTQYCFQLTSASAVTNPAANTYASNVITDGTDTTTVGLDIVSNDQISVTATVPPSFTLGFGGNSETLGTLSSSAVVAGSVVTLTVSTNAANGWGLWAEDANSGLHSTAASATIPSAGSVTSNPNYNFSTNHGTAGYGLGVTSANATTPYADAANQTGAGVFSTAWSEIASASAPASSSPVTFQEFANISGTTPAAVDYSDVITIVGAGSF